MKPRKLIKLKNCLKCQECCRFGIGDENWSPLFSAREVKRIGRLKIKAGWKRFGNSYRTRLILAKGKKELLCPFFDEKKSSCLVEKEKPLDCIIWPFIFLKNRQEIAINLCYYNSRHCPGLKEISREDFNDYKRYLIGFCKKLDRQKIIDISWDFDSDATFVKKIFEL